MKRPSIFLALFVLVSIGELLAVSRGWSEVHILSKSLIMLSLIGYYMGAVAERNSHFLRAMFFCWSGDVLLLKQADDEMFFILGLVSFLIGHLLYILAYRELRWTDKASGLRMPQKLRVSFPVALAGTGLIVVLLPTLGGLMVPVIVYAIVLMGMVMASFFRYGRTTLASFWLVAAGALFFMASDSILAINKFHTSFELAGPVIMLTYILGQYLIVEGVVRHTVAD
ncbi:MAG: lysoplasmalogenase [Cyclobacteriaceae bacterium]|nr:lysoplasmalogenase [Cyclobacteriaceae bacterium]